MRRFGLQTKALTTSIAVTGLFVLFVLVSLIYLGHLEKGFSLISNKIYPVYEMGLGLGDHCRDSKNWLTRYVIETDPEKIELWKKNFEESFKHTFDQFQNIEKQSERSLKQTVQEIKNQLNVFSEKVQPIIEKHEAHLAKVGFMASQIKEYSQITEAIQFHLNNTASRTSDQKLRNGIQELSAMVLDIGSVIKESLISPLEMKTENELNALLKEKRVSFDSKQLDFNKKFKALFTVLEESNAKKELRKVKLLNQQLNELVLAEGRFFDLLKEDIDDHLFTWRAIEEVNRAYENVAEKTSLFSQQVKKGLDESMKRLKIAKRKSVLFFMFLLAASVCFIFALHYFVEKRVLIPLNHLVAAAEKVEEGNLELKIAVPQQEDEIKDLILSFNSMIDKLSRSRKQIYIAIEEMIKLNEKSRIHETSVEDKAGVRRAMEVKLGIHKIPPEEKASVQKIESKFFDELSHEIRSPLTIIKQAVENLESDLLTKEQRKKSIEIASRAVERLNNLVTIYIDLSDKKEIKKAA